MKTTYAAALGFIPATSANALCVASPEAATPGCGKPHTPGFHGDPDTHSIISGGRTRTYAVRVPDDYNDDPNQPRKLILDFHGHGGTPSGQYNNSKYDAYPAGKAYLGVYPAGVDAAWQGAPYAASGVDDVQFVTDLLAHLRAEYCVDTDHVYASGKSNGGGFVDLLACSDAGDAFAAFAMAAAALYTDDSVDACAKRRAVMEAHGGADATIPYEGGRTGAGGDVPDIDDWVSWWGERNGCAPEDEHVTLEDGYETTTISCNGLGRVVEHYKIYGLGHCWPSSTGNNTDGMRSYCGDHALDFTPSVLEFFAAWDLASAPEN